MEWHVEKYKYKPGPCEETIQVPLISKTLYNQVMHACHDGLSVGHDGLSVGHDGLSVGHEGVEKTMF